MVMVMNLWTKRLPTTPETPLTRCSVTRQRKRCEYLSPATTLVWII